MHDLPNHVGAFETIFVSRGSIIDARDGSQRTPLHEAARQGHTGAVKILLQHNADMEAKDSSGDQPIHEAAYYSNFGYAKLKFMQLHTRL